MAVALLLARIELDRDLPLAVLRTAQESAFKVTEQVIAFVTSLNEEDLKGYWTICTSFFVLSSSGSDYSYRHGVSSIDVPAASYPADTAVGLE